MQADYAGNRGILRPDLMRPRPLAQANSPFPENHLLRAPARVKPARPTARRTPDSITGGPGGMALSGRA